MTKLKLNNPWKDEVDNRLLMAKAIIDAACELVVKEGTVDQELLWAARTLVEDAHTIFENQEFPGNAKLRGEVPWD